MYTLLPYLACYNLGAAIRDADMSKVAGCLAQHFIVAKNIRIPQEDIKDIEKNYPHVLAQQRDAVLRKWRDKEGGAATYKVLYDVLMELGEKGAAEEILDIAQEMTVAAH